METIGLRELKAHLSEFVSRARQGERIVITNRGEEVAALVPLTPERRTVRALVRDGRVRWKGRKPSGLRGVFVQGEAVADTVLRARR